MALIRTWSPSLKWCAFIFFCANCNSDTWIRTDTDRCCKCSIWQHEELEGCNNWVDHSAGPTTVFATLPGRKIRSWLSPWNYGSSSLPHRTRLVRSNISFPRLLSINALMIQYLDYSTWYTELKNSYAMGNFRATDGLFFCMLILNTILKIHGMDSCRIAYFLLWVHSYTQIQPIYLFFGQIRASSMSLCHLTLSNKNSRPHVPVMLTFMSWTKSRQPL